MGLPVPQIGAYGDICPVPASAHFHGHIAKGQADRSVRFLDLQLQGSQGPIFQKQRLAQPLRHRLQQQAGILLHPVRDEAAYGSVVYGALQAVLSSGLAHICVQYGIYIKILAVLRLLRIYSVVGVDLQPLYPYLILCLF